MDDMNTLPADKQFQKSNVEVEPTQHYVVQLTEKIGEPGRLGQDKCPKEPGGPPAVATQQVSYTIVG